MPPSSSNPPTIFISYRRSESAAHAGRLSDQLTAHFGSQVIFIDGESIEPGRDFVEAIEDAASSCKILLAVIGKKWLTFANEQGRRLDDPKDLVRLEIAAALRRGIRVIPVRARPKSSWRVRRARGRVLGRPDSLLYNAWGRRSAAPYTRSGVTCPAQTSAPDGPRNEK